MSDSRQLAWAAGGFGLAALVARVASAHTGKIPPPDALPVRLTRSEAARAIIHAAEQAGIDPASALLWADIESGLRADSVGDRSWHEKSDGASYQRHVLNSRHYQDNPYREVPHLWASYGLYQLLSPFWLYRADPNADPRILLDPDLNARLATRVLLAPLLRKYGDVFRARVGYVCDRDPPCSLEKWERNVRRLSRLAPMWGFDVTEAEVRRAVMPYRP